MRSSRLVFVLFLFCSVLCFADEIKLEEIVVTGSHAGVDSANAARGVDIVSNDDTGFCASGDMAKVLNDFTSVNISDYGGSGGMKELRMRGSTAAQVLVMVDGRPVNSPRDGSIDLKTIGLDNVQKIELLHGAASSVYGSQAMGGALNIITKKPPQEGVKTELLTTYGTYRTYEEKVTHGARLGDFGYLFDGGWQASDGYRANSKYNANNFNSKLEYEFFPDYKLSVNSGFYDSKNGTPGPKNSQDYDDLQKDTKKYVDATFDASVDDSLGFTVKGYTNYERLRFFENTAGSMFDAAGSRYTHTTQANGIDTNFHKQLFDFYQLVGGFDYVGNFNNSTSTGKHDYYVRAGYMEHNFDLFDKLRLSFAARVDEYSNFGTEFDPSFSFLYRSFPDTRLHGSIGRVFRAPTFNDLYWPDEGWAIGNPNLKPETGVNGEFGITQNVTDKFNVDVTYFRNDFNDLIQWAPDSTGWVWTPSNVGSALIDGVELKSSFRPLDKLEFTAGYTFTNAVDDKNDRYLVYQPVNKYDLAVKVKNWKGFDLSAGGHFYGRRYNDAGNTVRIKRSFVVDLDLEKKIGKYCTYLFSVDNLLDEKYEMMRGYPMPGFSVTSGLKVSF